MNNEVPEEKVEQNEKTETTVKVAQKKQRLAPKRKRIPLHKQKRIGIAPRKGYIRRLVNDKDGKIAKCLKAGWTPVKGLIREGEKDAQDASQMGTIARQPVGNGMHAVYMEIPEEIYRADQAYKQKEIDERDKMIGMDKIPSHVRRGKVKIDYGPPDES